jgi:hypothetical protein
MLDGSRIYTVFYGPYVGLAEACSVLARVGGDAFIRKLDNTTPVGQEPSC